MPKPAAKELHRKCSDCGDDITVIVDSKGQYTGGQYFGKIKGKAEYWECNSCYTLGQREDWLERKVRSYYGLRCPDSAKGCPCRNAWAHYDKIIKHNSLRGDFKQTYDKESDAAYIYINREAQAKRRAVAKTLPLSDYINLDFNKLERLIGIEVLAASKHMPKVFKSKV